MKSSELKVGEKYIAKVSSKLTTVRLDRIESTTRYGKAATSYCVTNLTTGRKTSFRSAMKFRRCVSKISGNSNRAWKYALTHLLAVTACSMLSLEYFIASQMPGVEDGSDAIRIAGEWVAVARKAGVIVINGDDIELVKFDIAARFASKVAR